MRQSMAESNEFRLILKSGNRASGIGHRKQWTPGDDLRVVS